MINTIKNGVVYRWNGLRGRLNRFLYKEPKVLDSIETLDLIIKEKRSICRLGDGEFNLIFGKRLGFQENSEALGKELSAIVSDSKTDCLIGIPDVFGSLKKYRNKSAAFWYSYLGINRKRIINILDSEIQYVNTNVTRFQTGYKDNDTKRIIIEKYKQIWNDKDIVFIEGEKTRLGVGNDLFSNARSISRILGPPVNAYIKINAILDYCTNNISKEKIVILALGPTATVLAYKLCNEGFWALDLGHIDIQYEYYLRGITKKQAISGKWVNESNQQNVEAIYDKDYSNSIIKRFDEY